MFSRKFSAIRVNISFKQSAFRVHMLHLCTNMILKEGIGVPLPPRWESSN